VRIQFCSQTSTFPLTASERRQQIQLVTIGEHAIAVLEAAKSALLAKTAAA